MMPRLFIAIDLPPQTRSGLEGLLDESLDVRWTPAEQFHLTLRFVGDVDPASVEDLMRALQHIESPHFELAGDGLDVFPSRRRPRVLVARVNHAEALSSLQAQVDRTVLDRGLGKERKPFNPHVTIGRVKGASAREVRRYMKEHAHFQLQPFEVRQFQLYQSDLGPSGAVHTVLKSYPFAVSGPGET